MDKITFLDQRLLHDAQVEIQEYAKTVSQLTADAFPKTMEIWAGFNG